MKRLENYNYTINNDSGMTNMEKLFREHYVSMVFYALKTVKDKNIAEDIVQDVFIHGVGKQLIFRILYFRERWMFLP